MRPSEIMLLALGLVSGLVVMVLGFGVLVDAGSGKYWFYWIAPLVTIATGAGLAALSVGYYLKVGRLASRGRPRRD